MTTFANLACALFLASALAGPVMAAEGDAGSGPTRGATPTNDAGAGPTKGYGSASDAANKQNPSSETTGANKGASAGSQQTKTMKKDQD